MEIEDWEQHNLPSLGWLLPSILIPGLLVSKPAGHCVFLIHGCHKATKWTLGFPANVRSKMSPRTISCKVVFVSNHQKWTLRVFAGHFQVILPLHLGVLQRLLLRRMPASTARKRRDSQGCPGPLVSHQHPGRIGKNNSELGRLVGIPPTSKLGWWFGCHFLFSHRLGF